MAKEFQDLQQLDSEDSDHQLGGLPPPQTLGQRLCSSLRLSLLALAFNVLLLVAVCVIGFQSAQLQAELRTLKETFSNFSSSTLAEFRALDAHGGSVGDKMTSIEAKLEKQQQDLKADHSTLLLHLKHFPLDLRVLACQMVFFKSNGTECCPVNWLEHEGSCYWFSSTGKTWSEAEKYCQLENSHLVVIGSWEEQKQSVVELRVRSGAAMILRSRRLWPGDEETGGIQGQATSGATAVGWTLSLPCWSSDVVVTQVEEQSGHDSRDSLSWVTSSCETLGVSPAQCCHQATPNAKVHGEPAHQNGSDGLGKGGILELGGLESATLSSDEATNCSLSSVCRECLTDSDGSWKWVDGTDYEHNYKNWAVTQPDNWHGHELGGSEDCVEVGPGGRWNDNFCRQVHRWVCEMRQNVTG
ncbi:Asialoglycoprotein receptor 2 [Tupaia chinensis]|uniref:Asialoglycoprotein receptor 2 n=1 Tax=Tupaia chinensis TaxID=246437 RepID=L9KLI9_TUPCH|nr:Asialoglycoprotein receptor 2 [Tupaia chinensis]